MSTILTYNFARSAVPADQYPIERLTLGSPTHFAAITYSGGTPTLQENYNYSSLTDNAVGSVEHNVTMPLANVNYAVIISPGLEPGDTTNNSESSHLYVNALTSSHRTNIASATGTDADREINSHIIGELA